MNVLSQKAFGSYNLVYIVAVTNLTCHAMIRLIGQGFTASGTNCSITEFFILWLAFCCK